MAVAADRLFHVSGQVVGDFSFHWLLIPEVMRIPPAMLIPVDMLIPPAMLIPVVMLMSSGARICNGRSLWWWERRPLAFFVFLCINVQQ